jgi:hypothetical protein
MPPEAGPDPTEARMKAFDFAADAAKQLITVTTAVVAFAAVLLTEFVSRPEVVQRGLFAAAMVAYLASIVLGLLAIFNMADELDAPDPQPPSIKHQRVSVSWMADGNLRRGHRSRRLRHHGGDGS